MDERVASLVKVCGFLSKGNPDTARDCLRNECRADTVPLPKRENRQGFKRPPGRSERKYSATDKTVLFVRDRFRDRYSGAPLIFPGVLRLVSHLFPVEFAYHSNWKYGVGHPWYWELYPTVDHIDSAGADAPKNWVTTSMMRNLVKSNASLNEHGLILLPPSIDTQWDGLIQWYVDYLSERSELRKVAFLRQWHNAARTALLRSGSPAGRQLLA